MICSNESPLIIKSPSLIDVEHPLVSNRSLIYNVCKASNETSKSFSFQGQNIFNAIIYLSMCATNNKSLNRIVIKKLSKVKSSTSFESEALFWNNVGTLPDKFHTNLSKLSKQFQRQVSTKNVLGNFKIEKG